MTTASGSGGGNLGSSASHQSQRSGSTQRQRLTTETKSAFKTTELVAYVVVAVGILVASNMIGNGGDGDSFRAIDAWRFITFLTIGYMVSRGLAKAGSRDPFWEDRSK